MINGASLGAFTNSCTACTTTLDWEHFTTTFVATGPTTTLSFINGDVPRDTLDGLDNVVLTEVPEPSSLALLGSGLLALAGMAKRKLFL